MSERPTMSEFSRTRERIAGRFIASRPGDAQCTVRLPEADMRALRAFAVGRKKTISEVVRGLVRELLRAA